jgi:hypothetical protein
MQIVEGSTMVVVVASLEVFARKVTHIVQGA